MTDGIRWWHVLLLPFAWIAKFFRPTPKVTREEVEAMVDNWGADWLASDKGDAVDDILWLIDRR